MNQKMISKILEMKVFMRRLKIIIKKGVFGNGC
jgi:hypothetical protein